MYAIVDVKDKQFKVHEDDTLYVPYHSDAEEDQELTLDRVLLVSDEDGDVTLGTPTVEDATVTARVLEHVKGDKVIVFKKKRRKRYRVKRGHRQQYTQIKIESLNVNGTAPTSTETDDSAEAETDEPADEAVPAETKEEASSDTDESAEDTDSQAEASGDDTDSDDGDAGEPDTDSSSEDNPFDQETAFDDMDEDADDEEKKSDSNA